MAFTPKTSLTSFQNGKLLCNCLESRTLLLRNLGGIAILALTLAVFCLVISSNGFFEDFGHFTFSALDDVEMVSDVALPRYGGVG